MAARQASAEQGLPQQLALAASPGKSGKAGSNQAARWTREEFQARNVELRATQKMRQQGRARFAAYAERLLIAQRRRRVQAQAAQAAQEAEEQGDAGAEEAGGKAEAEAEGERIGAAAQDHMPDPRHTCWESAQLSRERQCSAMVRMEPSPAGRLWYLAWHSTGGGSGSGEGEGGDGGGTGGGEGGSGGGHCGAPSTMRL